MTTPLPATLVEPPPIEPYSYGLLSVARVITGNGTWQVGGVEYDSDACAPGGIVPGLCPVPTPARTEQAFLLIEGDGTGTISYTAAPHPEFDSVVNLQNDGTVPITFTLTSTSGAPLPPAVTDPVADPADPTGMTAQITVDNTLVGPIRPPYSITLPPSGITTLPLEPGTYTLTDQYGQCTTDITVPFAPGGPPFVQCSGTAEVIGINSSSGSQFPVAWDITATGSTNIIASGSIGAGNQQQVSLAEGTYTVTYRADGVTPVTVAVTVPLTGALPTTLSRTVGPGTSHDKPISSGLQTVRGCPPFTVYSRATCNMVGFQEATQIARRRLELIEDEEAEMGFWDLCLYANLDSAIKPFGDTPIPLKQGLGALEQRATRAYHGRPTFHVPRWVHPYWQQQSLVRPVGPVQRTWLDSRVAFGTGYWNNSSPGPGGAFWAFATGTVTARRSEVIFNQGYEVETNTRTAVAERTYAFDHDCLLMAILLTVDSLDGPGAGGGV